jgi:single-strand DNA-binding protein
MYTVEKVIRNVNGKENVVKFITGTGNITSDLKPRVVKLKSGKNVSLIEGFGQDIAFDYYEKGEEKVKYFPLEIWGKSAEILGKYGKKGTELNITGRLEVRTKNYKGKKYKKEIIVLELFQITSRSKREKINKVS